MRHLITLALVGVSLAGCASVPKSVSTRLAKPSVTSLQYATGRKGWEPCYEKALELSAANDELQLKAQTFKDLPAEAQPPAAMEGMLQEMQMQASRMKAFDAFVQAQCARTPQEVAAFHEATALPEKIVKMQAHINAGAGIVAVRNILIGPR